MATVEPSVTTQPALPRWLRGGFGLIVAALAIMWIVEIADTAVLSDRLERNGILPRNLRGLDGILWAPFLHGGFAHLISNTIPFVLLSGLVLTQGARRYLTASVIIIVSGGLLVWLFAFGGNENHIGASGWVFGLFGYLIASAWFEKRPLSIIVAVVAVALYGTTILFGFLPRSGVSWEGHLFGLAGGVIAAKLITARTPSTELA